jgi:hypothetical protein
MAKITKVPNGPLIKKKGPFKGSTLKTGGTIKKAQNGVTTTAQTTTPAQTTTTAQTTTPVKKPTWQRMTQAQRAAKKAELGPEDFKIYKDSISKDATNRRVKSTGLTEQQLAKNDSIYTEKERKKKSPVDDSGQLRCIGNDKPGCSGSQRASKRRVRREARRRNGGPVKKAKAGEKVIKGSRPKMGVFRTTKERTTSGGLLEPFKYKTESIDTTGYSKGRANYKLKTEEGEGDKTGSKVKSSKSKTVSKKQVPGILKSLNKAKDGNMIKRAQNGESYTKDDKGYTYTKQVTRPEGKRTYQGKSKDKATAMKIAEYKIRNNPSDSLTTVKPVIRKNGGMIKRADGSYSKRGLWDNIRANKGSGKKPTKQMLVQEKKIKAKSKK